MAEGTPRSEVEQEVLHGAGADIPCSLWKRPLFTEVTAAASPLATKTLPHARSMPPAPKEKTGRDLPQSAGHTVLLKDLAPVFLGVGKNWGGGMTLYPFP